MTQSSLRTCLVLMMGTIGLAIGCGSGTESGGTSSGGSGASSVTSSSGGAASAGQSALSGGKASGGASTTGGSSTQKASGGSSSPASSKTSGGSTTTEGGQSGGGAGGMAGTSSVAGGTTGGARGGTGGGASSALTGGTGGNGAGGAGKGGTNTSGGGGGSATGGTAAGGTTSAGGSTAVSCPSSALAAGDTTRTIQSGGKSRTYVLHVPSGYKGNTAVPLLVDFHPHGSTGPNWRKDTPYLKLADADGVISAFPSAIGDWNVGPCCADGVDDVGFAKDMVKEIKGLACIDGKRVYAAGFSMGGGMTNYVACHAADVFAAFAPAAFALLQEVVPDCKPGRPITVVAFQGTADPYVPYAGGLSNLVKPINFLGAVDAMKKWAELSGCTGTAAEMGNGCQGYAASQCQGEEVVLCTKQGGQHEAANANLTWPILKKHAMP